MSYFRAFRSNSAPGVRLHNEFCKPCLYCNSEELRYLQETYKQSEEECWLYKLKCESICPRCEEEQWANTSGLSFMKAFGKMCCEPHYVATAHIPIPLTTVGIVERAVNAASAGKKGAEYRPHATFVHHLTLLGVSEMHKQALCTWAPLAMRLFMDGTRGVTRLYKAGRLSNSTESPSCNSIEANPDVENGKMNGVQLNGEEYGVEERLRGEEACPTEENQCATQIGPDLIPTEAFSNTLGNLKAGAAKRIKPPPYKGTKIQERRIFRLVSALIEHVFGVNKIKKWREENPDFDEFKSKKWSAERWRNALNETLTDISARIEQEAQIKKNEALPSKGKAPRPIIQTGDKGQIIMSFAVKCFEELLFEHFEEASIKHLAKDEAMARIAEHLRKEGANVVEGDGSAWDACCNIYIRRQTENRIIKHIIAVLGQDAEVPKTWLEECFNDMDKPHLNMKAKVKGVLNVPSRLFIDSIRQSGHRGTSCFNWLINYVGWLVVIAENPEKLVKKIREPSGKWALPSLYTSAHDSKQYVLHYAFEGDDSAISTTENLEKHENAIMKEWTQLGFNMKLIYAKKTFTFTGFNFLCDEQGPTTTFIPEPARNIASSSWSCSAELLSHPEKVHQVGAAAMLARAENFKHCGPFSAYFAALGLAHIQHVEDFGLQESEAFKLGIQTCASVKEELQLLHIKAGPMNSKVKNLMREILPTFSHEQEMRMLSSNFAGNPCDTALAKTIVPFELWDPALYEAPRRK